LLPFRLVKSGLAVQASQFPITSLLGGCCHSYPLSGAAEFHATMVLKQLSPMARDELPIPHGLCSKSIPSPCGYHGKLGLNSSVVVKVVRQTRRGQINVASVSRGRHGAYGKRDYRACWEVACLSRSDATWGSPNKTIGPFLDFKKEDVGITPGHRRDRGKARQGGSERGQPVGIRLDALTGRGAAPLTLLFWWFYLVRIFAFDESQRRKNTGGSKYRYLNVPLQHGRDVGWWIASVGNAYDQRQQSKKDREATGRIN
jgi:hypothetical protein